MEGDRTDHEFIIFGLSVVASKGTSTLVTCVASLGVTFAPDEIIALLELYRLFGSQRVVPPVLSRLSQNFLLLQGGTSF